MRFLALLLLLAVLPTVELVEQGVHVVEHTLAGEAADHDAHHDEAPGDEHGCTGLVHLCGHQVQLTPTTTPSPARAALTLAHLAVAVPPQLIDHAPHEPPHRPPIV